MPKDSILAHDKLSFKEGTSDKVYEIQLIEHPGVNTTIPIPTKYSVIVMYGRCGRVPTTHIKCEYITSITEAKQVYSKHLHEKVRKGYEIDFG